MYVSASTRESAALADATAHRAIRAEQELSDLRGTVTRLLERIQHLELDLARLESVVETYHGTRDVLACPDPCGYSYRASRLSHTVYHATIEEYDRVYAEWDAWSTEHPDEPLGCNPHDQELTRLEALLCR